jgi:TPR repeat protein
VTREHDRWSEAAFAVGYLVPITRLKWRSGLDMMASVFLGRLYYNQHDFAKAEELLSVGVSKNDPRAMYWLAQLYLATSLHGLEKIDEALVLLRRAMLGGHIQSGRKLGRMLMTGHHGYLKIFKGIFYFCSCTFRGMVIFIKNPSSEFLLDSSIMERMKQLRQGVGSKG